MSPIPAFRGINGMRRLALATAIALAIGACGGSTTAATTSAGASGAGERETEQEAATTVQPGSPAAPAETTGADVSGALDQLRGDLPPQCSFVDDAAMSGILGVEVSAEESYGTDCFYVPNDGYGAGLDAHTSALVTSEEECASFLQTEPILPGEAVEPASGYGDLASIITTEYSTELVVCTGGTALSVTVSGSDGDSAEQRLAAAQTILDEIIGQL